MPIVAFRKKIVDGRVPRLHDLFTECDDRGFFLKKIGDYVYTAPVTNWFPSYSRLRRVLEYDIIRIILCWRNVKNLESRAVKRNAFAS